MSRGKMTRSQLAVAALAALLAAGVAGADGAGIDATTAGTPVSVPSRISKVVVFPNFAEITRVVAMSDALERLGAGDRSTAPLAAQLMLEEIPNSINTTTLRVAAAGKDNKNLRINGLSHSMATKIDQPRDLENYVDCSLPDSGCTAAQARVQKCQDKVKELHREKESLVDEMNVLNKQKDQLNKAMAALVGPSKDSRVDPADLVAFLPTHREMHAKLKADVQVVRKAISDNERDTQNADYELRSEIARRDKERSFSSEASQYAHAAQAVDVVVSLDFVPSQVREASLEVTYMVQAGTAFWDPAYDVRVTKGDDGKLNMQLDYMGTVTQDTGEDWVDTQLWLSTASPDNRANPPKVEALTARFARYEGEHGYFEQQLQQKAMSKSARHRTLTYATHNAQQNQRHAFADSGTVSLTSGGEVTSVPLSAFGGMSASAQAETTGSAHAPYEFPDLVTTEASDVVALFKIDGSASITSNFRDNTVKLTSLTSTPKITYAMSPSELAAAYIKATAVNDGTMPLLASTSVRVFMEGSLTAHTRMKYVAPGQKFTLFLGEEPAISVKHVAPEAVHANERTTIFSAESHVKTYEAKTTITNNKAIDVELSIIQALPKSNDKTIEIQLIDPKPHRVTQRNADSDSGTGSETADAVWRDDVAGTMNWRKFLKSGEKVVVPFGYQVTWPSSISSSRHGVVIE